MRQTKNSSYKNLFSVLDDSENFFEVDILNRIKNVIRMKLSNMGKIEVVLYDINVRLVGQHSVV